MMDMTWTEQLSVGNAVIDSDHKKLMELVNDIGSLAEGKDSFELSLALKLFKSCMNSHSINEEQFAQALNFPFGLHKLAHQNMQTEIDFTEYELKKNSVAPTIFVMEHYPQFLRDWLIKHITEEDMLMKPALQAYPYDFKIGETYAWVHAGRTGNKVAALQRPSR
ncbi:MAG: hemerythrin domain-containing protein [Gallionella sp.]|nr:hemerythrin domain-containing protein [Gallionella sp.]